MPHDEFRNIIRVDVLFSFIDEVNTKRRALQSLTHRFSHMARSEKIKTRTRQHTLDEHFHNATAALAGRRGKRVVFVNGFPFSEAFDCFFDYETFEAAAANRSPYGAIGKNDHFRPELPGRGTRRITDRAQRGGLAF
jgi:hypothetical protein